MKMKVLPKAPIQIQRDELLERVKVLTEERKNLNAYNHNLKSDGVALRNTINEKDVLLANYQNQIEIDKKLLAQEQEKFRKKEEENKLLQAEVNKLKTESTKVTAQKAELTKTLTEKEVVIDNLKKELSGKSQALSEKQTIISELESKLISSEKVTGDKEQEIEKLKNDIWLLENDVLVIGEEYFENLSHD